MSKPLLRLKPGECYHLYNHANGSDNLFVEERNYGYFLMKASIYLKKSVKVYAYCLMPNHFHLLIRVRDEKEIREHLSHSIVFREMSELEKIYFIEDWISKSLANFFSSYTQSFNKVYGRKGSLFMPNFKRTWVENDRAFANMIRYIHMNPVKHGFVEGVGDWEFTSYKKMFTKGNDWLEREYVLKFFGGVEPYKKFHSSQLLESSELSKS